jgi:probable HAF family extracellular repeat protein
VRRSVAGFSLLFPVVLLGAAAALPATADDQDPAEYVVTPMAINNNGVIVGFANAAGTAGGDFNERPFIWTHDAGVQDLGTLDGDTNGQALGINAKGQIVGLSRGDVNTAVLWQDGESFNLNDLAPTYDGHLLYANDINAAGLITGAAVNAETGETVAYLARPAGE